MNSADAAEPSLAELHGITDRPTGIAKAAEARVRLMKFAAEAVPGSLVITVPMMTLLSLLTRAQAFHEGALDGVRNNNPFATFTLIRSYAENAAVLVLLLDKPTNFKKLFPDAPRESKLRIGQITKAAPSRFGAFKNIYDQLSKFAHPDPATALAGWSNPDDGPELRWSSAPAFKNDDDAMMACVWLIELAQANAHLWRECFETYFGETESLTPSPWER